MDRDQIIGGFIGVIIGDALGLPVQFAPRSERVKRPVTGMEGWGAFNMPPGSFSDDGSLTLCLAESIIEAGLDPEDAGKRFLRWYNEGYWTPNGFAYDIGGSTMRAMERMQNGTAALNAGPKGEHDNGNGSLMRILPAVLYLAGYDPETIADGIWKISRITHGHPCACSACYIYALMGRELLSGAGPTEAYHNLCSLPEAVLQTGIAAEEKGHFARILNGELAALSEDEIRSSGYVVDTLEAAMWCLLKHDDFASTLLAAVNLGYDTDSVAAVAGGLAGIVYGMPGIPAEWLEILARRYEIVSLAGLFADRLMQGEVGGHMPLSSYESFDRMYWVDPGRLLAGCYPGDTKHEKAREKLSFLVKSGVRAVINLMEEGETNHYGQPFIPYEEDLQKMAQKSGSDIIIKRMKIKDMEIPSHEEMRTILATIDQTLAEGRPVYLHCWGGHGRTGTVAGCYLVHRGLVSAEESLEYLNSIRCDIADGNKPSPQTFEQCEMVRNWAIANIE